MDPFAERSPSPLFPPFSVDGFPSSQLAPPPSQVAVGRVRRQLRTQGYDYYDSSVPAPPPFAAETAFAPSQVPRRRDYDINDDPLPSPAWDQNAAATNPDGIGTSAAGGGGSGSTNHSNNLTTNSPDKTDPMATSSTDAPGLAARQMQLGPTLQSSAHSIARLQSGVISSAEALVSLGGQSSHDQLSPASNDQQSPSHQAREWAFRTGLNNTAAHFYRGPLDSSRVLALLGNPTLSTQARLALTGTPGGYLKYYHFLGHSVTPPMRRRARERSTVAATGFAWERERWQCRLCHGDQHIPPGNVTNLGAHLYGTKKSSGCLILREANPAEPVAAPSRDLSGAIIRIHPDAPTPATRAPRKARTPRTTASSEKGTSVSSSGLLLDNGESGNMSTVTLIMPVASRASGSNNLAFDQNHV